MKHFNFVAMIVVMAMSLVSCSRSPQDKAEALVAETMKTMLYVPESYEPVLTLVDSAFAPSSSQDFAYKFAELINLTSQIKSVKEDVRSSKSAMSWNKRSYSEYKKDEYEESKSEYEMYSAKLEKLTTRMDALRDEVSAMTSDKEREFIGYKVIHRYRAKGRFEIMTFMSDMIFLIDKDMTCVMAAYDMDDPAFEMFTEMLE